ncbi:hypothetical protein ABZ569_32405 [Streptomyces albus]|uniref:hypothetical protein n=1 Tax=Streptomyces albus TaxID=1888 RepID=UPI0033CB4EC0
MYRAGVLTIPGRLGPCGIPTMDLVPLPEDTYGFLVEQIGAFDVVGLTNERDMWAHDFGKDLYPVNMFATRLALRSGHRVVIHGPVIVAGHDGQGEMIPLTEAQFNQCMADLRHPWAAK